MKTAFDLVIEKDTILNRITYSRVIGFFFLFLALPTFFLLPFIDESFQNWYFGYLAVLFAFFFVTFALLQVKYYLSYDYDDIGKLYLFSDKIESLIGDTKKTFDLNEFEIKLEYNGIRVSGFHFARRDVPRSGITLISLSDEIQFQIKLSDYGEVKKLKFILRQWYKNDFCLNEYTRTKESHRLIELEKDFEWKKLNSIKQNTTNIN